MRQWFVQCFVGLFLLLIVTRVFAAPDLISVYQQALHADPNLAIAWSNTLSVDENVAISRAGLLPNVNLSGSATINRNSQGDPLANGTIDSYSLSLTQPIFNYANWLSVQSSELTARSADASYGASVQDLIIRVTNAYFTVAERYNEWQLSLSNQSALAEELRNMKLRFRVGLSKTADVANAQAAFDNSATNVMIAHASWLDARADLQAITGVDYPAVALLKNNFPLVEPNPNDLTTWLGAVKKQNLTLLAARFAEDAARETIKAVHAGHYPVLSANVGYSGNRSDNNGLGVTNVNGGTASVSLNLPIYEGGLVTAQTHQAMANYEAALARYDLAYRNASAEAEKGFNGVITNINKIKSGKLAIASNKTSLQSTKVAYEGGIRTEVDVLTAQQTLYQTEINYMQARYAYFQALLNLKQASGLLNIDDLQLINRWLN